MRSPYETEFIHKLRYCRANRVGQQKPYCESQSNIRSSLCSWFRVWASPPAQHGLQATGLRARKMNESQRPAPRLNLAVSPLSLVKRFYSVS